MRHPRSPKLPQLQRRELLQWTAAATATALWTPRALARTPPAAAATDKLPIRLSLKYGMVGVEGTLSDRFALLKRLGYDGVELDSPGGPEAAEVRAATSDVGLPVHGVVDSIHWQDRLSSPDAEVRQRGIEGLRTAIRSAKVYGGSSVLLVPGRVANAETENQEQVWERSIDAIRGVLPLASKLGIHILIENVWNGFCYVHDGPSDQTAEQLAAYLDAIDSPWVGSYFDIGNHQKYGKPADWIRTLGSRIVKLDVKDWGIDAGFCKIGDGDVDWADVRAALAEIRFTGWATAEVGGGDEARLADILARMQRNLLG